MDLAYWFILGSCGIASFLMLLGLYEAWRIHWSPVKNCSTTGCTRCSGTSSSMLIRPLFTDAH